MKGAHQYYKKQRLLLIHQQVLPILICQPFAQVLEMELLTYVRLGGSANSCTTTACVSYIRVSKRTDLLVNKCPQTKNHQAKTTLHSFQSITEIFRVPSEWYFNSLW